MLFNLPGQADSKVMPSRGDDVDLQSNDVVMQEEGGEAVAD